MHNTAHMIEASYMTIKEMLADRSLDVSSFDEVEELAVERVVERSQTTPIFALDVPSCNLRVIYNLNPKYRSIDIKKVLNAPGQHPGITHAIILSRENPTTGTQPQGSQSDIASAQIKTIENFRMADLCVNISRHALQPKFEVLDEKDTQALLVHHCIVNARNKLPVIYSSDPMARYYHLKHGDVVRITRQVPSGGTSIYYRCCHTHKPSSTSTAVIREQDA
ncbi:hypothetical protein FOA52_001644 [Chlamydomonas sp. UWO 241]|jgi:DNA-directed RNA polymerase I, II, and III subunit RPABC1|nr:hypothetical protein FOA52_001644 [Chlamydomonas sp. UWO 241]